jgi:hypothetical protein
MKDVRLTKGRIKYFRSSAWLERGFCPRCGSSLSSRDPVDRSRIWFTVGALDQPAKTKPMRHIFAPHRVRWLKIDEDLPRHKARHRGGRKIPRRAPDTTARASLTCWSFAPTANAVMRTCRPTRAPP